MKLSGSVSDLIQYSILSVLLTVSCSVIAIHQGTPAKPGEFPFTVQLITRTTVQGSKTEYAYCGGSIVSPNVILTAGHCVHNGTGNSTSQKSKVVVVVIAGEIIREQVFGNTSQVRIAKHIFVHEEYNDTWCSTEPGEQCSFPWYDVALLVLNYPLTFNELVQPIPLQEPHHVPSIKDDGQICGWGESAVNSTPTTLQKAPVHIRQSEQCWEEIVEFINNTIAEESLNITLNVDESEESESEEEEISRHASAVICATSLNGSAVSGCQGDSGSPLLCSTTDDNVTRVCGVFSWGFVQNCGEYRAPQVFAAVANFSGWINEKISKFNFSCDPVNEFNCGDGACVPLTARCNNVKDCSEGTDEYLCGNSTSFKTAMASVGVRVTMTFEFVFGVAATALYLLISSRIFHG